MTTAIIELSNVYKTLGRKPVLQGIDMQVHAGEVVGIVGPNGSGKTSLLRLVTGLLYPDRGEVWVAGKRVRPGLLGELPTSVGAIIETPAFLPQLSGFANLALLASIRGMITKEHIRHVMSQVGLDPNSRKRVGSYSLGMRQRLGIAQAVMENPDCLVLDEPTSSLDSDGVAAFDHLLTEQVTRGAAVLLVSHVAEDLSRFCDRVLALQSGQLSTLRLFRERQWHIVVHDMDSLEVLLDRVDSFTVGKRVDGHPSGVCKGTWESRDHLANDLHQLGVVPVAIYEDD